MKKIFYGIVLFFGVLLVISESDKFDFLPNIIGAILFVIAAVKLNLFARSE